MSAAASNRRRHPRYQTELAAELSIDGDRSCRARICDLSYEGARIEGEVADWQSLGHQPDNMEQRLRLCFDLPLAAGEVWPVQSLCRIAHLNITETDFRLGLEFRDIEEGVMALADYIAQLQPSTG